MILGLFTSITASMILAPLGAYGLKFFGVNSSPLLSELLRFCVFALSFGLGGFITGLINGKYLQTKKIIIIYCPGFYYLILFVLASLVLSSIEENFNKINEVFWVLNPSLVLFVSYVAMYIGLQRYVKSNN